MAGTSGGSLVGCGSRKSAGVYADLMSYFGVAPVRVSLHQQHCAGEPFNPAVLFRRFRQRLKRKRVGDCNQTPCLIAAQRLATAVFVQQHTAQCVPCLLCAPRELILTGRNTKARLRDSRVQRSGYGGGFLDARPQYPSGLRACIGHRRAISRNRSVRLTGLAPLRAESSSASRRLCAARRASFSRSISAHCSSVMGEGWDSRKVLAGSSGLLLAFMFSLCRAAPACLPGENSRAPQGRFAGATRLPVWAF